MAPDSLPIGEGEAQQKGRSSRGRAATQITDTRASLPYAGITQFRFGGLVAMPPLSANAPLADA